MINLISMQIVIISYKILIRAIKLVKIICLEFFKINLNIFLKIIIFSICDFVLIEIIYYILIKNILVSYLNVFIVVKKDF